MLLGIAAVRVWDARKQHAPEDETGATPAVDALPSQS
jgi:hypothetical protein